MPPRLDVSVLGLDVVVELDVSVLGLDVVVEPEGSALVVDAVVEPEGSVLVVDAGVACSLTSVASVASATSATSVGVVVACCAGVSDASGDELSSKSCLPYNLLKISTLHPGHSFSVAFLSSSLLVLYS